MTAVPDPSPDILDALRAGPEVFDALLAGCTDDEARNARGGDEGWSVVEVVCHLRDAEERALERTRAMLHGDRPHLPAYDQEDWARERHYRDDDPAAALASFARFRRDHVAELERGAPGAWAREGLHEEQGAITVQSHAIHMAAHDAVHAAQIGRQLRAYRQRPGG